MSVMKESRLKTLLYILENNIPAGENLTYAVPDMWNCFDYNGEELKKKENGLLYVNPYKFYYQCINNFIIRNYDESIQYSKSLAQINNLFKERNEDGRGDWIRKSSIYSMHVRTTTSWDHDGCGELKDINGNGFKETGTFVKSIVLLPLLKKMGIDTIYLLPIAMHSIKNKKGEMGSPYAVKNFFKIDPELKDYITGDDFSVEDEFGAFVEACHMVGIRVMIDIIPRTAARDNELMLEHPEWFYWIRVNDIPYYRPPHVSGLGENVKPLPENLHFVYESEDVWNLIKKFTVSPDQFNSTEWNKIKNECRENENLNVLELIEGRIGITTAPAFSDCINDPQPPWDDVTFLRLYWDHPLETRKYMNDPYQPPYILHDIIKSNSFKGQYPNEDLWRVLSDVIPFYQRNFGIDGARIDMGHALPSELVDRIIKNAREIDKDFAFVAEELFQLAAEEAKKCGYNMIIGHGFYAEPRVADFSAHAFIYESRHLPLPVLACGETPDTPRLAARLGGERLSKCLTVINQFMPNGVPFINSGLEIYETQPMNTGLDCSKDEQWIRLAWDDPYNGKLAFFDRYQLHWTYWNRWDIADTLDTVSKIRKQYLNTITNLNNFIPLWFGQWDVPVIGLGWIEEGKKGWHEDNILLVIGNTDMNNSIDINVYLDSIRNQSGNSERKVRFLYSTHIWKHDIYYLDDYFNMRFSLLPGEVKIIKI
ncbi:maltodextrin glycosyltransferase [Clostridium polyendosporum]|uniref:Maltodextrin glycosyltransferase n=1 Tax=Clostridium polyendosporum TaxID=69208 RepID=A0A919S159_9CLOT|nr:alpha-amylase family glycosyl hydrolase [Clostridium polyendosporum]GIM30051.1 maltodextrin glycosyltransferase [Clostridium polyendosporum]